MPASLSRSARQGRYIPDLCDVAHADAWGRIICMKWHMLPGLDLYYTDPAQPLLTAAQDEDDLDHDMSDVCDLLCPAGRCNSANVCYHVRVSQTS